MEIRMRVMAPPKLNRFLAVLGRRPDGFHELELVTTVLDGLSDLHDELAVTPGDTLTLSLDGPMAKGLTAEPDNLVLKAWALLEAEAGRPLPCHLSLWKGIPHGAGLGGGSSDAAAALRLGNQFHGLGLSEDILLRLAAELGSDVPLFLLGGTVLGLGKGEKVLPLRNIPLEPMVLVHPGLHVPTPQVYRALPEVGYPPVQPLPSLPEGMAPPWRNDLTDAALRVCPELGEVRSAISAKSGDPLLCGSGACWVGRFPQISHRDQAAHELSLEHPAWTVWRL